MIFPIFCIVNITDSHFMIEECEEGLTFEISGGEQEGSRDDE